MIGSDFYDVLYGRWETPKGGRHRDRFASASSLGSTWTRASSWRWRAEASGSRSCPLRASGSAPPSAPAARSTTSSMGQASAATTTASGGWTSGLPTTRTGSNQGQMSSFECRMIAPSTLDPRTWTLLQTETRDESEAGLRDCGGMATLGLVTKGDPPPPARPGRSRPSNRRVGGWWGILGPGAVGRSSGAEVERRVPTGNLKTANGAGTPDAAARTGRTAGSGRRTSAGERNQGTDSGSYREQIRSLELASGSLRLAAESRLESVPLTQSDPTPRSEQQASTSGRRSRS